jgi:hypothetical protein
LTRQILHIFIVLLATSCSQQSDNSDNNPASSDVNPTLADSIAISKFAILTDIQSSDINERLFRTGDKSHFVFDSCSFYFECDCCFGDIVFNSDSTFYAHDYCELEESYTYGRLSTIGNTLTLYYSGHCTSSTYNEARGQDDKISPEYFYTDTILPPSTCKFLATKCGDKIIFQQIDGTEFLEQDESNYLKVLTELKKDTIFKRIVRLKQTAGNRKLAPAGH